MGVKFPSSWSVPEAVQVSIPPTALFGEAVIAAGIVNDGSVLSTVTVSERECVPLAESVTVTVQVTTSFGDVSIAVNCTVLVVDE